MRGKASHILRREIESNDLREWSILIEKGFAEQVHKKNRDLSFYRVFWREHEFIILYEPGKKKVVDIVSLERWEQGASKYRGDRNHFAERMKKRYGFTISDEDIDDIIEQIHSGQSTFLGRASKSRSFHRINWKSQEIVILYSSATKSPITVFPPNGVIHYR